jgi:hypothetical protein
MAFTLHTVSGTDNFSDDDHWRINEKGLLETTAGGKRRTYSPSGWLYIEQEFKASGGAQAALAEFGDDPRSSDAGF